MTFAPPPSAPASPPLNWRAILAARRPLVMGIVNVTPDSFSDGGKFLDPVAACAQAARLKDEGADILDIGAESTRPYGGQRPVDADEERRRLENVLPAVVALGLPVSIDTMKAAVARWALQSGAAIINDVWGLQRDPDMAAVAAEFGCPVVAMHNRDEVDATLDIVADMRRFFDRTLQIAAHAGIRRDQIMLDPGIGFGRTPEQSMTSLRRLTELKDYGLPILVGASRKRFIAAVTPAEPDQRLGGSIAAHLIAAANGADVIRAHDVAPTVQALRVAAAIANSP